MFYSNFSFPLYLYDFGREKANRGSWGFYFFFGTLSAGCKIWQRNKKRTRFCTLFQVNIILRWRAQIRTKAGREPRSSGPGSPNSARWAVNGLYGPMGHQSDIGALTWKRESGGFNLRRVSVGQPNDCLSMMMDEDVAFIYLPGVDLNPSLLS